MTLRSLGRGGPGGRTGGPEIGGATGGAGVGATGLGGVGAGVKGGATFFLSSEYCGVGTDGVIEIPFGSGGSVALVSGASRTGFSSFPT